MLRQDLVLEVDVKLKIWEGLKWKERFICEHDSIGSKKTKDSIWNVPNDSIF
jgi:hypothetical protein